jgi:hypothetical protein
LLVTKSAIRPGSNFNRQGGSIFHQRQHLENQNEFFNGRKPLEIMAQGDLMSILETYKRIDAFCGVSEPSAD